jgi:hypothetical protein
MATVWREGPRGWETASIREALAEGVRLVSAGRQPGRGVLLLVRRGVPVWVNGHPVLGGLRLLGHQDEVLVGRLRFFFSAESKPVIVPFRPSAGSRLPTCPVCRGPIREGEKAVECPGCGRWHHQADTSAHGRARHCWTYAATCRFCSHPTSLSGEPGWRPEEEGHG